MRERELTRRIREFFRLGSGDVQTQVGGSAYNPAAVAIAGGNSSFILAASFVAVSCPADATEDVLATIAVPALSANSILEMMTSWSMTNSVNNKTQRVRFNGASGTQYLNSVLTASASFTDYRYIANRGATNSQIGGANVNPADNPTTGNGISSAVDTSVATSIVISGQKASSGETLTLEGYIVRLYRP